VEASVFLAGKRSLAAEDAAHRLRTHHDVGRQELFQIISHEGEATGCRMSDDAEAMSAASWAGISAKIIYWLQVSDRGPQRRCGFMADADICLFNQSDTVNASVAASG
jgi:hypothetical protein